MTSYGLALVEFPIIPGKLNEAYEIFTTHRMGLAYTQTMPGFISLDVSMDLTANSIVMMEKWNTKEDWQAYGATRGEDNENNKEWSALFGPFVGGAPRMISMDCVKNYTTTDNENVTSLPYGVTLVEIPFVEGKLDEAYKLFTEHSRGLAYTITQPGFLNLDVAFDLEKNSILLFEKWIKKEDWMAYGASRGIDNEENRAWNAVFGPCVGGAPRMSAMDCGKNYKPL